MSAGHGRGHYGNEQLERQPPPERNWFKIAAVVGLGAVIWWWVIPAIGPKAARGSEDPKPPPPPVPPPPSSPQGIEQLEQLARARGFASAKAYEDAVVGSFRELEAAGARISLAPHLQHLQHP